jgi:hypothetical protein
MATVFLASATILCIFDFILVKVTILNLRKILKQVNALAQESGVSKSSARRATQLLKLRPYKTAVIQARFAAARST